MAIKNIHRIEQPREKLVKYGAGKLSDEELLAILLRTGPQGSGVLELAKKVLGKFSGTSVANATVAELMNMRGLGEAKACEIVACFELGRRMLQDKQSKPILSPREVWEQLRDIRGSKKEHFVAFFLNTQNEEIQRNIISVGILNANLVHPREVFEPAVQHLCSHILIAHNHPSGGLEPSAEDMQVTQRLVDAGKILGIEIIDHVIVTAGGFYSFKEHAMF